MDDLDRLHRRLVHNVRATRPEYLTIPFSVQELYEQLVPYRHNRRELSIETNQDYEIAIARLLSGERGYVQGDPGMQDALRRALSEPDGDPGIFKEYATSQVSLAPIATTAVPASAQRMPSGASTIAASIAASAAASATTAVPSTGDAHPTTEPSARESVTAAFDALSPAAVVPAASQPVPSLLSSLSHIDVPTGCRFCGGTLPQDREVNYCPHCGENLKTQRCPACGAELDSTWKFCVTCGRRTG